MGVESANYQVLLSELNSEQADRALEVLGAEVIRSDERATEAVVRDEAYWIDLKLWSDRPLISVRVALCNPPEVLSMLRTVLSALLTLNPAKLVDMYADAQFQDLGVDSWSHIVNSFGQRRDEFRALYGDYVGAVSATDVFTRLREIGAAG